MIAYITAARNYEYTPCLYEVDTPKGQYSDTTKAQPDVVTTPGGGLGYQT